MEFDSPLFNPDVLGYKKTLEQHRETLCTVDQGVNNKQIIKIAYAIKAVERGIIAKQKHAKCAFEFVSKCLSLSEMQDKGYSKILHSLVQLKAEFAILTELISSENFFDLLDSNSKKNRRVVFGNVSPVDMEKYLDRYKQCLDLLQFIETRKMELFRNWVGYSSELIEDVVDITQLDADGVATSYIRLKYNTELQNFSGLQYRLTGDYGARMSNVTMPIEEYSKWVELTEWVEKFMPEHMI